MKKRKLLKALELPEDIAAGATKLTLVAFGKIRVDNYKSLIEYEKNVIRINTAERLVKIEGKNLDISEVTDESVEIEGEISALSFE